MEKADYRQELKAQLVSLGAASLLALWLLLEPRMISALPLGWRLPVWLLGVWAVGAGFFHGMGLVRRGWSARLLGAPLCWGLMALLFLVLLIRSG
ncbi:hypothetical protein [Modicisalibacter xianhensis]|uniref:Cyd operon protein YbgE n=1 Tax=Modicisalibacter xianhensis TaxID=442341 RepID=A0A1I2Y5Y1_9GAMM|nr:hypothetical protein [Halomonas xianhensis]TDX32940.1 hypothetical protein DFO67_101236 [Halomonas xianhensis]SFH20769.1 hypothetical protein SAMN04487959_101234 [Halomonas xianhensis]